MNIGSLTPTRASAVTATTGAFLILAASPEPPPFTVYLDLGRYRRSDDGPIATLYGICCPCRWPRLSLTYLLTTDADLIASRYAEMEADGRTYECPGCGSAHIRPPTSSGDTYHCGHCGRVVELVNVQGSALSESYQAHLRQILSDTATSLPG